jgi:hypothetical protein
MPTLNGKELTEKQRVQLLADHKLGGAGVLKKYKTDQGGEHPVLTRAAWEENYQRMPKDNPFRYKRPYPEWVWVRIAFVANAILQND